MRLPMLYLDSALTSRRLYCSLFAHPRALLLFLISGLLLYLPRAHAETLVTDCDEGTLNSAIQEAADISTGDGVVVFTENCTIPLTAPVTISPDLFTITTNIVIDARGHNVTIEGDAGLRVFEIANA